MSTNGDVSTVFNILTNVRWSYFPQEQSVKPAEHNIFKRFNNFINAVKDLEENQKEEEEPGKKTPEGNNEFGFS